MTRTQEVLLVVCVVGCWTSVLVNVSLLATFIKLYSEVLKIGHIKNIGK